MAHISLVDWEGSQRVHALIYQILRPQSTHLESASKAKVYHIGVQDPLRLFWNYAKTDKENCEGVVSMTAMLGHITLRFQSSKSGDVAFLINYC